MDNEWLAEQSAVTKTNNVLVANKTHTLSLFKLISCHMISFNEFMVFFEKFIQIDYLENKSHMNMIINIFLIFLFRFLV